MTATIEAVSIRGRKVERIAPCAEVLTRHGAPGLIVTAKAEG